MFFNSIGRLRSGWRFAIFAVVFLSAISILEIFIYLLKQNQAGAAFFASPWRFLAQGATGTLIATGATWFCGRFLEDLPFRAVGWSFLSGWLKDFSLGTLLGFASLLIAVGIGALFGGLSFTLNQTASGVAIANTLLFSLAIFLLGAAAEEALFRGYPLQTFARARLAWLAIILTSCFFAYAHSQNPNVSRFGLFNTGFAGVWFGVAYLKTRNLWFPLGIHWAWNWMLAAVMGLPVSGITEITPAPLFRAVDMGPTWLTGGHYGIEGGAACTIALLLSTALIWFLPFFKPHPEMLALTDLENPPQGNAHDSTRSFS